MDKKKIDEKKLDEVSGGDFGNIAVAGFCRACGYKGSYKATPLNMKKCPKCGASGQKYLSFPCFH